MKMQEAIAGAADGEWIAQRAAALVEIPSETLDEELVCARYEAELRELGLEVDVRQVTAGRNNLYARMPGHGTGPTLMLNGHLDTVSIGSCPPCRREGDRLYGRGATDMKGGLAAMLGAARALRDSGVELTGDLVLTAVVGHEDPEARKDGPRALIDDLNSGRVSADRILIAEGPDALWVMSMGSMVFTIELSSDRGGMHTQYVPFGDNPIRHLGDLIRRIHELQQELDAAPGHPMAGPERIDLGMVKSGDYFNRTPLLATVTGTRRWAPGRDARQVLSELEQLAAPFAQAGGLKLAVRMEHNREPFETRTDDSAVQATARAHALVTGREAEYIGMRIVGDANLYVHGSGVPTFYYGPANETAHADVEWVSVARLESAARVYALTAVLYCGTVE